MPVKFTGWEAVCEKQRFLKSGQAPRRSKGYTMYHGTHRNNASAIITGGFQCSRGGTLGPGVYCSRDIAKTQGYPMGCSSQDRVVLELRVRVGKVKKMDGQNGTMWTSWQQQGYDTAWLPPQVVAHEEDCVADPKRVTVTGIAQCSDAATKRALEQLIDQRKKDEQGGRRGSGGGGVDKCKGCGIRTQDSHTLEVCWRCGLTICPFMVKHVCKSNN